MEIIILGCGDAKGVPRIGCSCPVCRSAFKKLRNFRTRSSIFIRELGLLIDTPPELRLQLSENKIYQASQIFLTHGHADHILGYDDFINYNRLQNKYLNKKRDKEETTIFAAKETFQEIDRAFPWLKNLSQYYTSGSFLKRIIIKDRKVFRIKDWDILPVRFLHGSSSYFYAFKFKNKQKTFGYIPDTPKEINQNQIEIFSYCSLLIIAGTKMRPKVQVPNYIDLPDLVPYIRKMKARKVILTHLSHFTDYYRPPKLPQNFKLAYQRMRLKV